MNDIKKKYTVLFVDDEPRITSALHAIFRRKYTVLIANSGADALETLKKHKVDVLVSDQRMPEMLGNELLATVSKEYPQTMRILLTGFMDKKAIVDSINHGEVYRFINKPWDNDQIREIISEAAIASEIPNIEYPSFERERSQPDEEQKNDSAKPVNSSASNVDASNNDNADNTSHTTAPNEATNDDRAMLMIEQQKDIRHQIRKFCSKESIMIYSTQNVEQAIAAATSRESIGVAIVELSEDTNEAIQTINLLKQARPELITITLTEDYDAQTAVDLINQGQVFKYLSKPLEITGFQNTIQNAFARHQFLKKNKESVKRFKVEKTNSILSNLQSLFTRFVH